MTADIVNLRRVRKAKIRAAETVTSAENRTKFGRTGAQRDSESRDKLRAALRLDGHRIENIGQDTSEA